MKFVSIILGALLLAIFTFLVLSYLLQHPAESVKTDPAETTIEFVDIDMENPECARITHQVKTFINQPQSCETVADCKIAHFGCPFGCSSIVNTTHERTIQSLLIERKQLCSTQCQYRCSVNDVKRIHACISNLCSTVESIETSESIREFIEQNSPIKNNRN